MTDWQNRIIKNGIERAGAFLANEENWRIHPRPQQEAVNALLEQVGWVQDVIVNIRSAPEWGDRRHVETLLDGHLRVTLALRKSEDEPVPVKYVDLSPDEEHLVLALLDATTGEAAADREKMDALLASIQTDAPALQSLLSKVAEDLGLYFEQRASGGDELDMDAFGTQQQQDVLFRVVVDNLSQDEARQLADGIENARVEQYRK